MSSGLKVLAALAAPALLIGLALEQASCSFFGACLEVALEFQLEGREQFSTADFWSGAVGYGLGLWLGLQLGWWGLRFVRGPSRYHIRGFGRRIAFISALGVLVGLVLVFAVTATRWGIDLPLNMGGEGPGDASQSSGHLALEWDGADHIPDVVEWWVMALIPWALASLGTRWALRRPRVRSRRLDP